jgi:hypothetical protein
MQPSCPTRQRGTSRSSVSRRTTPGRAVSSCRGALPPALLLSSRGCNSLKGKSRSRGHHRLCSACSWTSYAHGEYFVQHKRPTRDDHRPLLTVLIRVPTATTHHRCRAGKLQLWVGWEEGDKEVDMPRLRYFRYEKSLVDLHVTLYSSMVYLFFIVY